MSLPFDTTLGLYLLAIPRLEWQPDAAPSNASSPGNPSDPGDPTDEGPSQLQAPSGAPEADQSPPEVCLPRLRLVMTGVEWITVPTWRPHDNPQWELDAQMEKDGDATRIAAQNDAARRPVRTLEPDTDTDTVLKAGDKHGPDGAPN